MRLTEKETTEMFDNLAHYYSTEEYIEAINKLGQLEDIEYELGIDLITLFKALKNGITYKTPLGNNYAYTTLTSDRLSIEYKWKCLRKGTHKFYFKDYGKTWALTKEELE